MLALVYEEVVRLDAELVRLGRGFAALRLRIGEALEALAGRGGHHELGFSSLEAYARERCERSGRWAADSRALARRLSTLPRVRSGLKAGSLSWSMAEALGRVATPETEADWVARAHTMTVRQVRASKLEAGGAEAAPDSSSHTLTVTCSRDEAWLFEAARRAARLAGGATTADAVLQVLLNEAVSTLCETTPPALSHLLAELEHIERRVDADRSAHAEWCSLRAAWRVQAEVAGERLRLQTSARAAGSDLFAEPLPEHPEALDYLLRRLCSELAEWDLRLGSLAEQFRRADGFRRLGFVSEAQYARERVGLSLSSLKARRALALRCRRLPALGRALASGTIGYDAAYLVSRVATPNTADAWIARARERTVKNLREEVEATELVIRFGADRDQLPPAPVLVDQLLDIERWIVAGDAFSEARGTNSEGPDPGSQMSGGPPGPRRRVLRALGTVTFRWHVTADTYRYFRALERVFLRVRRLVSGKRQTFFGFLCESFCRIWVPVLRRTHLTDSGAEPAYFHIYRRDAFRCTSPVCSRRDVTPHHLTFRSHGGGDDESNLTTLCSWCHLRGIHGGRIAALPPASRIRWRIGRRGTITVEGRTRIAA